MMATADSRGSQLDFVLPDVAPWSHTFTVVDGNSDPVDMTGCTITWWNYDGAATDVSATPVISGVGNNVVDVSLSGANVTLSKVYPRWSLNFADGVEFVAGDWVVDDPGEGGATSSGSTAVTYTATSTTITTNSAASASISSLTDTVITGPLTDGDILRHNGTAWVDVPGTDHFDGTGTAAGLVSAHEADTTNIHGIADTSELLDSADIGVTVQAHSAVLDATTASFTTADESKLDGIEALADVTDETNVTAALSGATLTDVGTPAGTDMVLLQDASDGNALKATQASELLGGGGGGDAWSDPVDADIVPDGDGTRDLGTTTIRFAETFTDSLDVTANVTVGGTVDGRDLAVDGTKLDGVEALADVTDETNVTAALSGATLTDVGTPAGTDMVLLQDASDGNALKATQASELLGGGDAWSDPVDADIVPDSDGTRDLGTTTTRFAETFTDSLDVTNNVTVGGTVDGRDLAVDGTKLDGVEALADVTDETNVTAALSGATLTDVGTPAGTDMVLLQDASDGNALKATQASELLGGGGGGDAWSDPVDADIVPDGDGTRDLGTTTIRFAETFTDSLDVTANVTVGGTVDGRDLAVDGTKLDLVVQETDGTNTSTGAPLATSITTGTYNTNTGVNGQEDLTAGNSNTNIGANGQRNLTAGDNNTNVGRDGQLSLTTGDNNANVGRDGQRNLTTGSNNTNTGGYGQRSLTTGNSNTNAGLYGQNKLTTGSDNTTTGRSGQQNLTTGNNNTNIGKDGQLALTTGNNNTNNGKDGQRALTTGDNNISTGANGQRSLTTGSDNTSIGRSGQYSPGGTTANATTTASRQTSVGTETGLGSTSQDDDITTIGYRALGTGTGATSLGSGAHAAHAQSVALGMSTVTTAANQVAVDDRHFEATEISDPGNGAANSCRIYARDNGSGKTQFCVVFGSGAVQVMATEP